MTLPISVGYAIGTAIGAASTAVGHILQDRTYQVSDKTYVIDIPGIYDGQDAISYSDPGKYAQTKFSLEITDKTKLDSNKFKRSIINNEQNIEVTAFNFSTKNKDIWYLNPKTGVLLDHNLEKVTEIDQETLDRWLTLTEDYK